MTIRPAPSRGSVGGNALSDYRPRNRSDWVTERIKDVQRERTAMGVAPVAKRKRFGQVARSLEISVRVVEPNSVSELESSWCRLLPSPEANVSGPWVDVRVVNFGPAGIPDLEGLLDLLIPNQEAEIGRASCRERV